MAATQQLATTAPNMRAQPWKANWSRRNLMKGGTTIIPTAIPVIRMAVAAPFSLSKYAGTTRYITEAEIPAEIPEEIDGLLDLPFSPIITQ